jgi:hypothetical protein
MDQQASAQSSTTGPSQTSLFDLQSNPQESKTRSNPAKARTQISRPRLPRSAQQHGPPQAAIRTIEACDLPDYPPELIAQVDRTISALPAEKLWFTYSDIKRSFGISRATIARRMKDGLVPGIRVLGGRVLDDGAVRRFDRTQVRWLLLSLKAPGKPQFGASAASD